MYIVVGNTASQYIGHNGELKGIICKSTIIVENFNRPFQKLKNIQTNISGSYRRFEKTLLTRLTTFTFITIQWNYNA